MSGRQRMIDSVNGLTDRDDCTEAVLLQERPRWAPLALVAGVVGVAVLLISFGDAFSGNTVVLGAVAGGAGGLLYAMLTTYWIVARVGDEVVLARSSRWSAKAVEIVERHPVPTPIDVGKGLMQSKVTLGDRTLYSARQFVSRLEAAVS